MTEKLLTKVKVSRRFTRAVRVDADLSDPRALDGYVCSPSVLEALRVMARHHQASGHGAFTWTGPYGSGKSSLAVALAALLSAAPRSLLAEMSEEAKADLSGAFRKGKTPWRVVAAVGRRETAEEVIAEALAAAVGDEPNLGRRKSEGLADWARRVAADPRRAGLLLLIDEMGKFLEHAAREDGDVHLFQDLAEVSSRSGGRLLVVGILHQAFDEYAHRLAREARDEWIKIQGRYLDIPINLAAEEQLDLIGRAIAVDPDVAPTGSTAVAAVADTLQSQRLGDAASLSRKLEACWPLHPIVAALLGPISRRRFGQNQRSLFGFLNSVEPCGFQAFLEAAPAQNSGMFPPSRLWDYLHANLEPAILASPDGHRWSTALEAVSRAEARNASADHLELLKTVALIDLFKDRSGLQATRDLLVRAFPGQAAKAVESRLSDLIDWSVLIHRKHAGAYAIYAGSDFDIEQAVDRARETAPPLDYRRLARFAGLQPILAKRHYETTGALRWFEIELAAVSQVEDRVRAYRPSPGSAGLFLLTISGEGETAAQAATVLKRAVNGSDPHLVVAGWTSDSFMIREMAADLAALEHVRGHRRELEGDSIARREVDARITRLSADLEDRMANAVHRVKWRAPTAFEAGAASIAGPAGLSILASRLADWRYPDAPRLANELVNRSRPSANAAAAVRALLRAMIERHGQPRLGFTGFPAEAGLYVSVLQATGLHRQDTKTGVWGFHPPEPGEPHNLHPLWIATDAFLSSRPQGASMEELFELWRSPPLGVRDGLFNILAAAYLLTRSTGSAIYLDKMFRPRLDSFLIDRMVQEPGAVRVRAIALSDIDTALISGLAERLSEEGEPIPGTAFDIARALIRTVRELPLWTQRTQRLDPTIVAFRDRARLSDDPNQFLSIDLPQAFGWEAGGYSGPALARQVLEALTVLRDAYGGMLSRLEATLLKELRVKPGLEGLAQLRRRAGDVKGVMGNFRLDALATRLATFDGGLEDVEGFASLAANKPPRDWVDRDLDAAAVELAALAHQFLKAELMQHLKDRKGGRVAFAFYISDPAYPEPRAKEISLSSTEHEEAEALARRFQAMARADGAGDDIVFAALARLSLGLDVAEDVAGAGTPPVRKAAVHA